MRANLHMHTTRSHDVAKEIEGISAIALIKECSKAGISVISITEHDKFDKDYFRECSFARSRGVVLVPGVEFDAEYENLEGLHILAYFHWPKHWRKQDWLKKQIHKLTLPKTRQRQINYNTVVHALVQNGYLKEKAIMKRQKHSGSMITSKVPLAYLLMNPDYTYERFIFQSEYAAYKFVSEFYKSFHFEDQESEDVVKEAPELVRLVKSLGGITSVAHPLRIKRGGKYIDINEVKQLVNSVHFDGIEVFYPYDFFISNATKDDCNKMVESLESLALKERLIVTGGSDFHGYKTRAKPYDIDRISLPHNYTLRFIERLKIQPPQNKK